MIYNFRFKFSLIFILMVLLGACQIIPITDPASLHFVAAPGSVITVHKTLTINANRTRVFLQHGKVVENHLMNEYRVNCNFEVNTLGESPRFIQPGQFTVTHVERRMDSVVLNGAIQLAAAGTVELVVAEQRGTPMMFEEIRFSLHSDAQLDVRELACRGAMANMADMELPTRQEIQAALGSFASIGE
jgi:hypothetical protein